MGVCLYVANLDDVDAIAFGEPAPPKLTRSSTVFNPTFPPMVRCGVSMLAPCLAAMLICFRDSMIEKANGNTSLPAFVSESDAPLRENSGTFNSRSSEFMCLLSVGCDMFNLLAASVKLRKRASSTNSSRYSIRTVITPHSIRLIYGS